LRDGIRELFYQSRGTCNELVPYDYGSKGF
jgi:hypothetical protein